jgi:hypothetical protein
VLNCWNHTYSTCVARVRVCLSKFWNYYRVRGDGGKEGVRNTESFKTVYFPRFFFMRLHVFHFLPPYTCSCLRLSQFETLRYPWIPSFTFSIAFWQYKHVFIRNVTRLTNYIQLQITLQFTFLWHGHRTCKTKLSKSVKDWITFLRHRLKGLNK